MYTPARQRFANVLPTQSQRSFPLVDGQDQGSCSWHRSEKEQREISPSISAGRESSTSSPSATPNEQKANQIKKDAEDQLDRVRNGRSALASKLLADGHSIVDVLFGSDEIAHLIDSPTDDNPLTLSELRDSFVDHLRNTDRTPGHIEGTLIHTNHFIRILGDVRVMTLT